MSRRVNLSYGPDAAEVADVYLPQPSAPSRPAVLVVHGGGWHKGSRHDDDSVAQQLASVGFVVVNVDYTLASPSLPGYPMQVQDLEQAVRWIRANATSFGVDPMRIGAVGASAGGTLVQLLADTQSGSCTSGSRIAVAVSWSGPTDLTVLDQPSLSCPSRTSCGIDFTGIADFAGCAQWNLCPAAYAAASPVNHVTGDTSPLLLYNSSDEVIPAAQATEMGSRLAAANVPYGVTLVPGTAHAEAYSATALPGTIAWLERYLG
jgi:acetyl esterase/lipase